jgi:hypothetical protein
MGQVAFKWSTKVFGYFSWLCNTLHPMAFNHFGIFVRAIGSAMVLGQFIWASNAVSYTTSVALILSNVSSVVGIIIPRSSAKILYAIARVGKMGS